MISVKYKGVFSQDTVEKIEELLEDSYALEDIINFIDANCEEDFRKYYEDYCAIGEEISYEAVDAFIEEFGLQLLTVSSFEDSYLGCYDTGADFVAKHLAQDYDIVLPDFLKVDLDATLEYLDVVFTADGYVFRSQF